MNSVIFELDEVFMHSTPNGWKFSAKGEPQEAMTSLRVEIEAIDREDWDIQTVSTVTPYKISEGRWEHKTVDLQGTLKADAVEFLNRNYADFMQDKIDLEIVPEFA